MGEKLNKEEVWRKCLLYIKNRIQETAYQTWFTDVKISSISEEDITILVPNKYHYEWLESKYRTLIDESIINTVSYSLVINYTVPISSKTSNKNGLMLQRNPNWINSLTVISLNNSPNIPWRTMFSTINSSRP